MQNTFKKEKKKTLFIIYKKSEIHMKLPDLLFIIGKYYHMEYKNKFILNLPQAKTQNTASLKGCKLTNDYSESL